MAEWFKAHAWKACLRLCVSRVRTPLSPLILNCGVNVFLFYFNVQCFL